MLTLDQFRNFQNVNLVVADTGKVIATNITPIIQDDKVLLDTDRYGIIPFSPEKLTYRKETNSIYFEIL